MYIRVKIAPNSKKESIIKKSDNIFEISVKEKAERNMANDKVRELVASYCKVSIDSVRIINGHHSPTKLISINNDF